MFNCYYSCEKSDCSRGYSNVYSYDTGHGYSYACYVTRCACRLPSTVCCLLSVVCCPLSVVRCGWSPKCGMSGKCCQMCVLDTSCREFLDLALFFFPVFLQCPFYQRNRLSSLPVHWQS